MKNRKYYYNKNRDKAERLKLKRLLVDLLGGKCIDCGYNHHLAALDFDHVNPKEKKTSVSWLLSKGTKAECLNEALKCVIRCSNCHRIKTYPTATI
jgi:hypothetical protein